MSLDRSTAVLLDDFPLWLDAVEQVVTRVGIAVVGKTSEPDVALELVERDRPDLLVADLGMSLGSDEGVSLLRRARQAVPDLKVIVLSSVSNPEYVQKALAAGASVYVLKTAHPDDLAVAVRQAFTQSVYFADPHASSPLASSSTDGGRPLTRREREILGLVAEGSSNGEVAKTLWVTEQTVKFHLSNIYRKLKVANRTEASRWAHLHDLVQRQRKSSAAA